MRSVKLILALLLLSCPAWATWTLLQDKSTGSCSGASATCSVTMTSTGAGHLITAEAIYPGAGGSITSASCGGTLTHCPSCFVEEATNLISEDGAYILSSSSGTTSCSITLTTNPGGSWKAEFQEWSFTGSSISLDTGATPTNNRDQTTTSTSIAGPSLTLSGTSDVIVEMNNAAGTTNSISGGCSGGTGYTLGTGLTSSKSIAYCYNTADATAPTWTQATAARAALGAMAFQEGSGAAATVPHHGEVF